MSPPGAYDDLRKVSDMFINVMRHATAINGSFFNTQCMMKQYVVKAYCL
jgi:hypothetical protein